MSRLTRLLCVVTFGIYGIYLAHQFKLEPILNIIIISLYCVYLCWEEIHATKIREIELKEHQLKFQEKMFLNKIVDKL